MQIIKENLDIDDVLEQRIKNTLKFLNIKSKIISGWIVNIFLDNFYKDNCKRYCTGV